MKILFTAGRHDRLTILATGQVVERDEVVDVPDDVARRLLTQGWKPAQAPSKKKGATTTTKTTTTPTTGTNAPKEG